MKCKKPMPKHELCKLHIGQFLDGIAVPTSDFGIGSTKDKDFTDKPYCKAIVSDKQAFCQALDYVAYAVLRYHIGFFYALRCIAGAIKFCNTAKKLKFLETRNFHEKILGK